MEFQFLEEAESQTAPQQNAGGLQFEYIQGAKEATVEPEPREFFSFEDAVSAIGTIPEALAVGVPAAYQKLVTGLEIPEKSEAIESELAFQQRIQTEQADRVASGKATTFGSAIREALPSLGFSVLPMAAAIPAGIGGTMVGGPAAPVTGPAAAMAASGTVAYRMAGSDMMYRAYKQLEEAKGSPLTNEEKAEYYKTVLPIAQNYGLWEAGPEAVSNAITIGVGKFVFGFGKQAAKKLVGESIDSANKTIARKVAEKGAAVAGGLGTEIASEGVTSVGQYPEEAKIRQLAATGEVSKGEQPSYPGGYMQAVKDVAPATIALYGMMGTAAGGVKLSTLPFRSQKTPEQIAEDNINLEADRVSRELSIGETDEETKSINSALQTARNNLIAKKEVYTALEPNDPAAQSLGLEIREMEREVVALDNELKKRIGEPLSEPITEAERQQAELAKAIVEEPAPTEPLPVPPAQAAPVAAPVEQVVTPPVEVAPTIAEAAPVEPVVSQEFKDELEMSGVAYYGDTRYSVQQSSNGTFRAERIVNGKKEDIQIGLPDIETAQNVIFNSVGKEVPAITAETPAITTPEIQQQVPSGMSVEEAKAYLEERNKSTILGYAPEDIMAMQQGKRVARTIPPAPVTEQAAPAEAPAPEVAPAKEIEKKVNVNGINITAKVPIRYFRFGEPTIGEPSTNFLTGKKEKGISVYAGWTDPETGKIYLLPTETDETEFGEIIQTQDALLSSERKLVEVNGVDTGKIGADGEILLEPKSVSIVSEIDKNKLASTDEAPDFAKGKFTEVWPEGIKKPNIEIKEVEGGFQVLVNGTAPSDTIWATREVASEVATSEYEYEMRKAKKQATTPAVSETITEPVTPTEVKTTTEPTKTSPVASTSKAAGDVVNEIERVVDIKGVRAAKQIFDKVIQTLESLVEESKASAGFQTVEFRPSAQKKYGLGTIFIDGEYVASVGKYGDVRPNEEYELKKELPSSFDIRDLSPAKLKQSIELGVASKIARRNNKNQKYIVRIPGDGTFKIESNPIAVAEVVRRIKTNGPSAWKGIYEPKLGEKGGVLIPTKEDFIQAGQNIYEAGMEFGAWAKQMIQRFGDAVREFLGEVWQAVSGAPAKLNELMGYLPGKGEVGAVNIGRGKIGEKAKPSEEAEAEEKTTVKRGQVASIKNAGAEKKTPEQIIARTKELLRQNFFNPSEVTEQNTLTAFRALGKLVGNKKEAAAYAEELNDIGRLVDEQGVASEVSMGAILFTNDLFEYSIKLAAEGQKMMLGIMMSNMNRLPLGEGITLEESARAMRGALERSTTFTTMGKAEQDAYINYVAEFMYGPNPTKEQIQSIKDAYSSVDKTKPITEEELTDELEDVGKKTGTDLVGKINIQIEEAAPPTQNPIVSAMLTLQKLYGGTIETRYTEARESAQKIKEGVKKILTGGISNYRGKMVEGAASGLESGFWKTLSSKENKPGPLGELDAAQNRELGNIVKSMLVSMRLQGTPPNTKMDIYEQVASILGEKPLSNDKIKLADEKIRDEIKRKREKELDDTDDSDIQDAINLKYDVIEHAWDEAMARQLDMPISGSMLRRLIFNELKEDKTSVTDLAKMMNDEPVIAASRQDRVVNSIITKIAGVTFEGQNPADYSALKEYLGKQLEALIIEKQTEAKAARAKEQLAKDAKGSVELQAERAENEAQSQIERLAKIQSDTPSFPAEAQMNPVREAVKNALKLSFNLSYDPRNEPDAINNLKKNLALQLQSLGVKEEPATILASVVARQVEINSLNNKLKSIDRAIEKGPISEIVKAIKDTPLEDQQKPNWRYEVMRDYLRKAGLPLAQAERIAKLMDISLQKRFTMAQEQAFTDAISKSAPWKTGDTRSRRAFQKVLQALRAGALDPARNVLSDMAALNGWTGFTPEQYKDLLKYDAILSDPKAGELKKAEAYKAIQDVISKAKLPIRARNVIGQYYDAQALSGIPTLTVNAFSPIAFAMRNAIIEIGSGTLKGNPKAITNAATALVDSIKSWANTVAFSFKNNVTVYSNVDYIVNDDNLLRLYRRGVDQFKGGKTARDKADGVKNMMVGMMDYVRRILNALDYGAIASLQNQNISKYAMAVMKNKGMNNKQANEVFAAMMKEKNDFYLNQIAIGTDKNKASILADEYYISSWKKSLEKEGVGAGEIKSAMDAAINDALSSVGRNRQSLDAFKEEATNLKDAGLASSPALWLLESVANAANRSDSQFIKVFSRVIYGFAIVPARVIRETAWFSPYGFVRLAVDKAMRGKNMDSRYAQSLGSDFQRQQRFNEAVAGTVALIALASLRGSSTDEPEEDEFKIVFTGNGPKRIDDPQFYDSWYKAGNKPNSMIVSFGKTKIPFNMMRGFEAFTWPAMMLGAVDDLEIRKKQKRDTNTNTQIQDASIVAGFVFDAALRRGPYAFTTKSLFGTYGDIGVEGVAKGLTFPAKTLIPVLGTSLASNLSNFINDPIDRRTLDGAVWSNIPFIGPAVAPKSLNAFGEPALSTDFASKMFKLGVPLVYDIPTDRESIKLHELVLKQGGGPSIPTRNQLAQRLDRQPTNKEYEMFVKEYGAKISSDMKRRYEELSNKTPEKYSKSVEKIGNRARDIAERKVREAAKKP